MQCVQSILDFLFTGLREAAIREIRYLTAFQDNVRALEDEMAQLMDARDDLKTRVELAETQLLARTHQVDRWLNRVTDLEAEVAAFDEASVKSGSILGNCSPDRWWANYKLGKRASQLLADVRELKGEGSFDVVAEHIPPEKVVKMPSTGSTVGTDPTLEALRGFIQDDDACVIAVYGLCGSGKTTLLRKLNNELISAAEWSFNLVILLEVSNGDPGIAGGYTADVDKLQQEIGERLDLTWQENETRQSKAAKLFHALEDKRFVLLLDDVWKPVDLELVGVPLPSRRNRCKVVLTTTSQRVGGIMGAHHKVEVKCLREDEAWEFFIQNAGREAVTSHPQIMQLAKAVAGECGGLPLALMVVGRALSSKKTVQEWKHALTVMQRWPPEIPGVAEKVLSRLKLSYDNLPNDTLKSCFLYCSLFPGHYISKEELVNYWVGEGFLDESMSLLNMISPGYMEEARNKGYDLIGELLSMFLLEEGEDPELQVRMHDVVRDLAIWIASEEGKNRSRFLVEGGGEWKDMPDVGRWEQAERISLTNARVLKLGEAPNCPALLTLMLQGNWGIHRVPDGFFNNMPVLRVLNLSYTRISMLPVGIGFLAQLQYLNLSGTSINSIPDELGNLKKLRQLDLSHTNHLASIPSKVMLGLTNLQVFNVFKSSYGNWKLTGSGDDDSDEVSFEDMESMEQLRAIGVSVHSGPSYNRYIGSDVLPELTHCLHLQKCGGSASINVTAFRKMRSLKKLHVGDLKQLEEFVIGEDVETENGPLSTLEVLVLTGLERSQIRSEVLLPRIGLWNLRCLEISFCHKVKNITWVLKLGCLKEISLSFCDGMEMIIDYADEEDNQDSTSFPRLRTLKLNSLKNLRAVGRHVLVFPSLESLHVSGCPKLNKLPLGALSGWNLREIHGEEEWWNGLEWQDVGISSIFLHYFKMLR